MSIESGVDLKEKIPIGWKIIPLRWYISCKSGESIDANLIEKEYQQEILLPVIGGNGIMGYSNMINTSFKTLSIGRVGALCGNVHYIDYPCWITDNSLLINYYKDNEINLKFLKLVLEQLNLNHYSTSTAQPLITGETIKKRKIALPPLDIQKLIVGYVQQCTNRIDRMITLKQNLISLLEEKRQSIISEAVIKGLDSNVKMKNSSIEWIGEIPEHWISTKVIYYSKLLSGGTPDKENIAYWEDGTINWVTSGEVNKNFIYEVNSKITKLGLKNSAAKILPVNSVMMALNGQGKTKGKVAVLKTESTCNQSLAAFICDENKLNYLYLYYYLKSKYRELRGLVGDGLRDGISLGLLKSLYMPFPPIKEQKEIADYLYKNELEIEKNIVHLNQSINLLKEYHQSLIYEAVTGKVDVRESVTEA